MPLSFHLGFVVNPFAGIGGVVANKGSDDNHIKQLAYSGKLELIALKRAGTFIRALDTFRDKDVSLTIVTVTGSMGSSHISEVDCDIELINFQPSVNSTKEDTIESVRQICERNVDLLVFVGGDGTARDLCGVIPSSQVVLGVPAGVKMHSGVFAVNPQMAAEVVVMLIRGELVRLHSQEVRDIDELAFRAGVVKSQYFGDVQVPEEPRFLQNVKQGGFELEELVLLDIAEHLQTMLTTDTLIVLGPGSTTKQIAQNWGLSVTLLGVDLILNNQLLAIDVNEWDILQFLAAHSGPVKIVITAIGGQGHIFGRGNQQISSSVLKAVGRENVLVVATKTKLKTLNNRPFMMDSGDEELDQQWRGYMPVITGFDDIVLYRVGYENDRD